MTVKEISKERLVQIINDYISNDYEAAEGNYIKIKETLENVCGMNKEEAEALGLGYIFDC